MQQELQLLTADEMKSIKELALEIFENKVFGEWDIPEHSLGSVIIVFIPLIFMSSEERLKLKDKFIYGYYSEAGPRGINGLPIFDKFYFKDRKFLPQLQSELKMLGYMREMYLNHTITKDKENETK